MSQYVDIQVEVKSLKAAVEALKAMGFTQEQIQVSEPGGLPLIDYTGEIRRQDLNLRVSREHVGRMCNDFGVRIAEDGSQVFICNWTREHAPRMLKFMQEYAVAATTECYADQGKYVERIDDKETGKVHLFVQGG